MKALPVAVQKDNINSRLTALIRAILEESRFDPTIKRIVSKMIINFLKSASEEVLEEKIKELRDDVIPFVLYGNAGKTDGNQTENPHQNG